MPVHDLSSNKCFPLGMPNSSSTDLRLKLECRSGSSTEIFNSRIFVFGGCVLELNLFPDFNVDDIYRVFVSEVEKRKSNDSENSDFISPDNYNNYLSNECFRLSLINRKWYHYDLESTEDMGDTHNNNSNSNSTDKDDCGNDDITKGSDDNKNNKNKKKTEKNRGKKIKPDPRMFHSICIYEKFLFINGGVNFDSNNKIQVLNDLWRFDTIEKEWICCYQNGNDQLTPRFDHFMLCLPNLEIFDKNLIHPGIVIIGGLNLENEPIGKLDYFDMINEKFEILTFPYLSELLHQEDDSMEEKPLLLRESLNGVICTVCPNTKETKIAVFDKSPSVEKFEPVVIFSESVKGYRYLHQNGYDINGISNMKYPKIGIFGESMIIIGFLNDENKISSFIFNYRTHTWNKLQISCLHKIYSHKLSKGFVWESHHKVAFLGSMKMNDSFGSVNYFDNLVILSLPFTNFFGKKLNHETKDSKLSCSVGSLGSPRSLSEAKSTNSLSDHNSINNERSNSLSSFNSKNIDFQSNYNDSGHHLLLNHQSSTNNQIDEISESFAAYAHHVAQQMQVNSIRSVLPSYAIAIGKNAFERNTSLSDFDLVCCDGTVIPVPLTLCRRRWGLGFDEIFADAYAKAYIEGKAYDILESNESSNLNLESEDDLSSVNKDDNASDYSSIRSKNSYHNHTGTNSTSNSVPNFRLPFQDKDNQNSYPKSDLSPIRNIQKRASVSSRNNSIGAIHTSLTLQRASLSLSKSRNNSIGNISRSRHSSMGNISNSRRNSIGIPQSAHNTSSASRRGSVLSKTSSLMSSSINSNNSGNNAAHYRLIHQQPQTQTQKYSKEATQVISPNTDDSILSHSPTFKNDIYNGDNNNKASDDKSTKPNANNKNNNTNSTSKTLPTTEIIECFNINDIPPQAPMPGVLPDIKIIQSDNDLNLNKTDENNLFKSTFDDQKNYKKASVTDSITSNMMHIIDNNSEQNKDNLLELDVKFNPLRIPRSLYLPYSRETVHGIVEYFYSGQIGANWKLFPTGIELLLATKQLNIPLLYDLVLELFFVVLGIMEAILRSKIIKYLEKNSDIDSDEIYNLLDMKGKDDLDMDWNLLLMAMKECRRDSESTITSDMDIGVNENDINDEFTFDKNSNLDEYDILDLSDLGPTDVINKKIYDQPSPKSSKFKGLEDNEYEENLKYKVKNNRESNSPSELDSSNNELNNNLDEIRNFVKLTTGTLDEEGYDTSEDSDNGDEIKLINSFKKFNLKNNYNTSKTGENDNTENMNDKNSFNNNSIHNFKKWPSFKELLQTDNEANLSSTIISLFIETSALINDDKLMLQSIHVQELLKKYKELKKPDINNLPISESTSGYNEFNSYSNNSDMRDSVYNNLSNKRSDTLGDSSINTGISEETSGTLVNREKTQTTLCNNLVNNKTSSSLKSSFKEDNIDPLSINVIGINKNNNTNLTSIKSEPIVVNEDNYGNVPILLPQPMIVKESIDNTMYRSEEGNIGNEGHQYLHYNPHNQQEQQQQHHHYHRHHHHHHHHNKNINNDKNNKFENIGGVDEEENSNHEHHTLLPIKSATTSINSITSSGSNILHNFLHNKTTSNLSSNNDINKNYNNNDKSDKNNKSKSTSILPSKDTVVVNMSKSEGGTSIQMVLQNVLHGNNNNSGNNSNNNRPNTSWNDNNVVSSPNSSLLSGNGRSNAESNVNSGDNSLKGVKSSNFDVQSINTTLSATYGSSMMERSDSNETQSMFDNISINFGDIVGNNSKAKNRDKDKDKDKKKRKKRVATSLFGRFSRGRK